MYTMRKQRSGYRIFGTQISRTWEPFLSQVASHANSAPDDRSKSRKLFLILSGHIAMIVTKLKDLDSLGKNIFESLGGKKGL